MGDDFLETKEMTKTKNLKASSQHTNVKLVDAHHHFWNLEENDYPWLLSHPEQHFFLGPYDALKKNYLPADYRNDSQNHNVVATVHCEAEWNRDDQVGETQWLTQLQQLENVPTAIVAHAWFHTDNSEEVMARQAQFPFGGGGGRCPVVSANANCFKPYWFSMGSKPTRLKSLAPCNANHCQRT